ncbi:uncharacterized protein PHA67_016075 [Liasis olivaceus]
MKRCCSFCISSSVGPQFRGEGLRLPPWQSRHRWGCPRPGPFSATACCAPSSACAAGGGEGADTPLLLVEEGRREPGLAGATGAPGVAPDPSRFLPQDSGSAEPPQLDYRTLAAVPSNSGRLQKGPRCFLLSEMEKDGHLLPLLEIPVGHASPLDVGQAGSARAVPSEEQSLVDSQPIPFSASPFVLANRQGPACLGALPLATARGDCQRPALTPRQAPLQPSSWRGVAPHAPTWLSSLFCLLLLVQGASGSLGPNPSWCPAECLLVAVGVRGEEVGEQRPVAAGRAGSLGRRGALLSWSS